MEKIETKGKVMGNYEEVREIRITHSDTESDYSVTNTIAIYGNGAISFSKDSEGGSVYFYPEQAAQLKKILRGREK